jgi:hypothetical protein
MTHNGIHQENTSQSHSPRLYRQSDPDATFRVIPLKLLVEIF